MNLQERSLIQSILQNHRNEILAIPFRHDDFTSIIRLLDRGILNFAAFDFLSAISTPDNSLRVVTQLGIVEPLTEKGRALLREPVQMSHQSGRTV